MLVPLMQQVISSAFNWVTLPLLHSVDILPVPVSDELLFFKNSINSPQSHVPHVEGMFAFAYMQNKEWQ